MSAGQKFTVIGGPQCNDTYTWWNIQGDMGTGWAAEADDKWWMAPMTEAPTTPAEQVVPNSTQPSTQTPLVEAPIELTADEEPFFCDWWLIGWLACGLAEDNTAYASTNTTCHPQCVEEMRIVRADMTTKSLWANASTSDEILKIAMSDPKFQYLGQAMQVRVRDVGEAPKSGDVVIWPSGCGNVWSPKDPDGNKLPGGHIGQVLSTDGITINIHDSNWYNNCRPRDDVQIQILPCMRFVTEPFPVQTAVQPTVINCGDYQGWQNFACNYLPWWKPK